MVPVMAACLGLGSSGGRGCTPWLITAWLKFGGIAVQFVGVPSVHICSSLVAFDLQREGEPC